jgi:diguanylate cyclase (GGDEF)-like protein
LGIVPILTGLLAWRSVTAVGIVGLGPIMLAVALYAGHFLPPTTARLHVLGMLAVVSAGAWASAPSGFLIVWINVVLAVAVTGEVHLRLARQLRAAAGTDPLTGVANRRAWEAETERHLARAARTGEPVTVAILDLDDFKLVNDQQGHDAGDALLRELTDAWGARLRHADVLGRYGGDEFVLCLPATAEPGARRLLEQLDQAHAFSWSTGVATAQRGETMLTVLARADADLYQRKQNRRVVDP